MALENHEGAARDLEYFLDSFPGSSFYDEGLYWKGRLLFIQNDFDNAIRALYNFIELFPEHEYTANAYFWIAESLYSLGHLEKSQRIFNLVLSEYPTSYKVEASRYRLSLIEMKNREEELMRLLKMSHEEYLFALEEFQRREKSYDQAIAGYQRKLTALTAHDKEALVQELSRENQTKDGEISALERQVSQLKAKIIELSSSLEQVRQQAEESGEVIPRAVSLGTMDAAAAERESLLELKMNALLLKEFYIDWLIEQQEGK
jgi:TolA-binding protein